MDRATGVGDGDGVEVVHQAPEGFVEGSTAGGAVAAEEFVAVTGTGGPVVNAVWVRRASDPFLNGFPLIVVIKVTDGAADGAGGAAGQTVIGVSGDGGAGLGVVDLHDPVPGIPDDGVPFAPITVFVGSAGRHVACGVVG